MDILVGFYILLVCGGAALMLGSAYMLRRWR